MKPTPSLAALAALVSAGLAACGGDSNSSPSTATPAAEQLYAQKVPSCASGSTPETALQGQVPAALRASGFKGFNCNLTLVGQSLNEGGNWSTASFTDGAGHTCAYHATATPTPARVNPGVPVIDMTDRANPTRVESLDTASMVDPWESLRINARRQFLIGDNARDGAGGPEVDIYDVSGDCRSPQLMSTLAVGTGQDGGIVPVTAVKPTPIGHEGNIAPDGLTYYVGDITNGQYYAVDVANTTKPKMIAAFDINTLGLGATVHGMSVSNDGTRMYGVILGGLATIATPAVAAPGNFSNGFAVFDTSQVQARVPNAQIKLVSQTLWGDGTVAQATVPISVAGKPYMLMEDEGGSAGLAGDAAVAVACTANADPFPVARLFDLSDETHPKEVSQMGLETHNPANCAAIQPDVAGLSIFTYGSHYCSVDNRDNATAIACSYFNSGIRVFDIRNPAVPKEIAYYNPAGTTTPSQGSSHYKTGQWRAGGPDWCASRLDFDFAKKQLITMCQDNGLVILQFAANTWPFAESTPSLTQN